jgi:hypothetical protein
MDPVARKLVEQYGAIVRTEFHLQIPTTGGHHDIWFSLRDGLKWRLYGDRKTTHGDASDLYGFLDRYNPVETDLGWMRSLTAFIAKIEGYRGIFVDAGWKEGVAKAAIVKVLKNGDMEIFTYQFHCSSSHLGEMEAINKAKTKWPGETIYSDCQGAAHATSGVQWIPRRRNQLADALGNRRGT